MSKHNIFYNTDRLTRAIAANPSKVAVILTQHYTRIALDPCNKMPDLLVELGDVLSLNQDKEQQHGS